MRASLVKRGEPRTVAWRSNGARAASALVAVVASACGGSGIHGDVGPSPSASMPASSEHVSDDGPPCTPDTRSSSPGEPRFVDATRDEALSALAAGRTAEALDSLAESLRRHPNDLAAFTLYEGAVADESVARRELSKRVERGAPLVVPPIAFGTKGVGAAPKATLRKTREASQTGDYYAWLTHEALVDPTGFDERSARDPQSFAQTLFERPLTAYWIQVDHFVIRYGQGTLLIGSTSQGARAVSFEELLTSTFGAAAVPPPDDSIRNVDEPTPRIVPEVRYADVVGHMLVAEIATEGDGSAPPVGFLVGIDLETQKAAWSTDGTTANGTTFYATNGFVLSSYGDDKSAKVVLTDAVTGRSAGELSVPSRAQFLLGKEKTVYAWEITHSDAFEIETEAKTPAFTLGASPLEGFQPRFPLSANARCHLRNVAVALDHRDATATKLAASGLGSATNIGPAAQAVADFIAAKKSGAAALDLTEINPTLLPPPEGEAESGVAPAVTGCRLSVAADPSVRALAPSASRYRSAYDGPMSPTPVASTGVPDRYGIAPYYLGFALEEREILVYGMRFVAVVSGGKPEHVFDFRSWSGGASGPYPQPLAIVTAVDSDLLVVANAPSTSPRPGTFLARVEPASGRVVWRSPLGNSARTPVVFEQCVVAAIRQDGHASLVALRSTDGKVLSRVSIPDGATDLGWDPRGVLYLGLPVGRRYFSLD